MKLGFPLMNENELANDFAHSKYIGIFDDATGNKNVLSIVDSLTNEKLIFESLVKNELNMVVSPFYSFLSLRIFKENHIMTCKAKGFSIDENIAIYKLGKIKTFDIYDALLYGDCAKDCMSCSDEEACD